MHLRICSLILVTPGSNAKLRDGRPPQGTMASQWSCQVLHLGIFQLGGIGRQAASLPRVMESHEVGHEDLASELKLRTPSEANSNSRTFKMGQHQIVEAGALRHLQSAGSVQTNSFDNKMTFPVATAYCVVSCLVLSMGSWVAAHNSRSVWSHSDWQGKPRISYFGVTRKASSNLTPSFITAVLASTKKIRPSARGWPRACSADPRTARMLPKRPVPSETAQCQKAPSFLAPILNPKH